MIRVRFRLMGRVLDVDFRVMARDRELDLESGLGLGLES